VSRAQAAHLGTGLAFAAAAALAAAFAVVFFPSLPGEVVTGAFIAFWISERFARRHRKHPADLALVFALSAALAAAVIAFAAPAVPAAVFAVLAAAPARHYLDPRRARVVRTTRGAAAPAKASGGRPGRPGEKITRPRAASSRPAAPRSPRAPRPRPAHVPPEPPRPAWPHVAGLSRTALLPFAGEGDQSPPADLAPARKLRKDEHRPSALHRSLCSDCLDGQCGRCADRGCECPQDSHPARPARRVPRADDLPDEPLY
jgi:hypothetical protein